jgi:hypothetical protein
MVQDSREATIVLTTIRAVAALLALLVPSLASAADPARWTPQPGATFSILLSVSPRTIATPADVVDIDGFDARAATVADLKAQGKHVICYFSAGSWENWRPDKADFPGKVKGKPLDGWPGERYLDIRNLKVLGPIMQARMDVCKQKGFDAVDPDNVDAYQADTGFPLTRAHAIAYVKYLAKAAHARGLAIGLKNTTEIANAVLPKMDFAVTEDCYDQGWCPRSKNVIAAGKPVFAIEYTDNHISFDGFCRQAAKFGLSPIYKKRSLNAWEQRCPGM